MCDSEIMDVVDNTICGTDFVTDLNEIQKAYINLLQEYEIEIPEKSSFQTLFERTYS